MTLDADLNDYCDFVCNGKTYKFEQKLRKAVESELYDAAIIYSWKIFMLFLYEKLWQIREIENIEGTPHVTDMIFLPEKVQNPTYFSGNLFSFNKLDEHKRGDDALIGKIKDIYTGVDPQIFKAAQQVLKIRHEAAHQNSIDQNIHQLSFVLSELLKIVSATQNDHVRFLKKMLGYEDDFNIIWHFSEKDKEMIESLI